MINSLYLLGLFTKYNDELLELSIKLQKKYYDVNLRGFRATFSDFEGEILYMLIRERKPKVVYEISPDAGYSTNYSHSALCKNKEGILYCFELEKNKNNKPTQEVIKKSLIEKQQNNIKIIIGDAMLTVNDYENPDIVIIDSCHEDFFAEWYLEYLVPRTNDLILIQDILFYDRQEYSSEANVVINFIKHNKKDYISLGELERKNEFLELRSKFYERFNYQTNSLLFSNNEEIQSIPANLLDVTQDNQFDISKEKTKNMVEKHINRLPERQNLHRTYIRLYLASVHKLEKKKYLNKAIGSAISTSTFDNKSSVELLIMLIKNKNILIAVKFILFNPSTMIGFLRYIFYKKILKKSMYTV